jgi:hypothetical protein
LARVLTVPRTLPCLASMRWIVGTETQRVRPEFF